MSPRHHLLCAVLAASLGTPLVSAAEPWRAADDAVAAMRNPVSFAFATHEEGHELLLTDVHVVIRCAVAGKVFEGVSEGPFLVASMADGRYEVVASHDGRPQRAVFTVGRGEPHRVSLVW